MDGFGCPAGVKGHWGVSCDPEQGPVPHPSVTPSATVPFEDGCSSVTVSHTWIHSVPSSHPGGHQLPAQTSKPDPDSAGLTLPNLHFPMLNWWDSSPVKINWTHQPRGEHEFFIHTLCSDKCLLANEGNRVTKMWPRKFFCPQIC